MGATDIDGRKDHVIVWGLHGLGLRIVEQLRESGEQVVVVDDGDSDPRQAQVVRGWGLPYLTGKAVPGETLAEAGIAGALALICVERTDLRNLEIALLARELRPDLRVVTHIRNAAVGRALADDPGPGAVLDVAAFAAPSVAEACLRTRRHEIELAGTRFLVADTRAPRDGTLRQLYGDRISALSVDGGNGGDGGDDAVCPGPGRRVRAGDEVTLVGTPEDLRGRGIDGAEETGEVGRALRAALPWRLRSIASEAGPGLRRALASMLVLIALSTVVLWHGYAEPGMSPLDGLYFSLETIATVGFGDFSFADQPTWLRLYAIALMVLGVTNTAVLLAYLTDLLVSRRLERTSGRRRAGRLTGHVIIVGLGTVGVAAMTALHARGARVVVIESDDENRFLAQARELGVPVLFGDATVGAVLASAGAARASAIAVLTSDDMVNIETALAIRDLLGERWNRVPVVPRIFDRTLARTLADRFGFTSVRSTAELAAPWFVGAALGLDVLGTFTAHQRSFMAGRFTVTPGSDLDGLTVRRLPEGMQVLAIGRGDVLEHPPGAATRLGPGDCAYVIGRHEDLLRLMQRARTPADQET